MGIFYLLLAKLSGIIKVIAVKKCGDAATGVKNSIKINLIRSIGCLIVSLIVFLLSQNVTDKTGIGISLLSGVCNAAFLFLWILTAECTSLCLVELFCMLGSVVIPLFLTPFLYANESVLWYQWVCTGVLFVSAFLFFPKTEGKTKISWQSFLLLVGCAISSAGTVITQKLYITYSQGTIASFHLISFLVVASVFAIASPILAKTSPSKADINPPQDKFTAKIWGLIALATVMLYTNQFLSTQAAKYFVSAVFYPLSYAIGWPMTFLADTFVFKEKVTARKVMGVLLTLCASVFISL